MLNRKVKTSLEKYGVHCVVGNILNTRYLQVSLTTQTQSLDIRRVDDSYIESLLITEIVQLHSEHCSDMAK